MCTFVWVQDLHCRYGHVSRVGKSACTCKCASMDGSQTVSAGIVAHVSSACLYREYSVSMHVCQPVQRVRLQNILGGWDLRTAELVFGFICVHAMCVQVWSHVYMCTCAVCVSVCMCVILRLQSILVGWGWRAAELVCRERSVSWGPAGTKQAYQHPAATLPPPPRVNCNLCRTFSRELVLRKPQIQKDPSVLGEEGSDIEAHGELNLPL